MQGNEQHAPDDRRSSPVAHPPWTATRLVGTVLLCGGAALFSAGFWLTRRADDPAVFGWYAPQWFAMAICATLLSGLVVYWRVGRSSVGTSRRTAPSRAASGLSVGKRIAFIAIILAPVMIGLELTLRHILRAAAVVDAVERVDPDIHYHAHLQMVKRENVDGAWVRGFRGRVPQRDKTTGLRVVCLGGSTTFGTGVEPEQAWPTLLEKTLRAEGFDVEVINAGFPWYATADSVVNYSLLMRYYHPDVVVVMHGINDLCRSFPRANEPPLEWDYGSYQGPMRSVWDTVRRRRMNRDDRGGVGAWLRALATYRFVCAATGIDRMYYSALRSPRRIQPPAPDGWSPMPSPMAGPVDSERDVGVEAFGSIEPFAAHLNYLVELCQRDGCRVVLGTQAHIYGRPPERDQPQPRHFIRLLACHLPDGSLASPRSLGLAMDAIRAATVEVAERQQLPLADVDSAIASNANLLLDDFHLSIEGNAIAADVFAEQLRPILDSIR